jgi:DNA-binding response OmpR family regulator/Tfp pilus assembly protein PilZ
MRESRRSNRSSKHRAPRLVARCQVEFEGPLGRVIAESEDLSDTGLFVRTDEMLPVASRVALRVTLPTRTTIKVEARVAHLITPSVARALGRHQGMGLALESGADAIRRYLAAQRRADTPPVTASADTRVVVVESSAPMRERVVRALSRIGFAVDALADGDTALRACEASPPDAVVVASTLADRGGDEVVKLLACHPLTVGVPVVMIGDDGSDLARLAAYRIGVREYIPKPFTDEELVIRTHRLVVHAASAEATASLRGTIGDVGLSTLLSLFEFERKSGILMLMRETEIARVLVGNGRIIKVETGRSDRPARDRLLELLDWTSGQFEFAACTVTGADEVGLATTPLLLEHARSRDERKRGGKGE